MDVHWPSEGAPATAGEPGCSLLTQEPATGVDRRAFLELLRLDEGSYLEPTLRAMGSTWEKFSEIVDTVGEVRVLRRDSALAGYVWIELRGRELHIHGVALVPEMRRQGIGTCAFFDLETEFRDRADVVELGVHESNADARRLYERLGFRTARTIPNIGFVVLRKPLRG